MSLARADGMRLAAQLRSVLKEELLAEVANGAIELVGRQQERSWPMTYAISGLPGSATVIDIRKAQHLKGLADGGELKQICDYLIVAPLGDDERCYAVRLEMKTTIGDDRKPREQLRGTLSVVLKYVLVGEKYHHRFDKQRTRAGPIRADVERHKGIEIRMLAGAGAPYRALVE